MFNDLREYITRVEELGELRVIEGADWDLEIGHISELALSVPNPPLLLFDKIKGYPAGYRVVTGVLTSPRQVSLGLELPLDLSGMDQVRAWRDKVRAGFEPVPPMERKSGSVKENIHIGDEVDLYEFPTPKYKELDGGRYIGTGDMVIQKDPDSGWVNLGTYRVQIQDSRTATIHSVGGHHGALIAKKYWDRGLSCPTAVVCGADPQLWGVSLASVPLEVGEYDYAGWIRNKPVEVVRGETVDLPIPATAEIVLEGDWVPPEVETRMEGPFGEWEGYYAGGARLHSAFRVNAILHRNDPILVGATFVVASSDDEPYQTTTSSAALWDELDRQIPGVTGVCFVGAARRHPMVVISMRQQYSGHAKQAAMIAAGAYRGASLVSRFIIVVDDDIDPSNISEVLWALATRCDPETSIDIIGGRWSIASDPRISPEQRERGELVCSTAMIYACKPFSWMEQFPHSIKSSSEVMDKVKEKWGRLLFGHT